MKKIIILPTAGDSREDGSVYYSDYVLVESTSLQFDEPIFNDDGESRGTKEEVLEEIRRLGYHVEEPETAIVHVDYDDDDY